MDKGIILAGEAAQAYITYKYIELLVIVGLLVCFGVFLYKVIKRIDRED